MAARTATGSSYGHGDGTDAAEHTGVVAVEGLEDEDFVAGIEQGAERCLEGSGGSGGDEDFAVGIDGERVGAGELGGDGVAQARDAVEAGVDVVTVADGALRGFGDDGRRVGVADALGEVDAAHVVAGDGHGANLGLKGARGELAEVEGLGGESFGTHVEDDCTVGLDAGLVGGGDEGDDLVG